MNKSTIAGIVGAIVCLVAIAESARIGFSRASAMRALSINDEAATARATRVSPNDGEVHAARGIVLQRIEKYPEAVRELERAVELRPRDYFLWLQLGVTRDLNDDQTGAVTAMRQAVALAPNYAKPRWFIGNLLIRTGQIDEAFEQLRLAAERDSSLLPNIIDLAWGVSANDAAKTIEFVQPHNDRAHIAVAKFFAAHDRSQQAIDQFRAARSSSAADADQLTESFIQSRSFGEAYEVWSKAHCASCKPLSFVNGSFEEDVDVSNRGFGWQIPANVSGATLSIDTAEHADGQRSFRVDFNGITNPRTALISQWLIVAPGHRYRISFHAKTKSFLSVAVPSIKVIDASDERLAIIAQSLIPSDAEDWRPYTIDFSTGVTTRAVRIVLQREDCPGGSCAAFGTLWLDSFLVDESPQTNTK